MNSYFFVEILWAGSYHRLFTMFPTRSRAESACAAWRSKFGRPTAEADPFRVVEVEPFGEPLLSPEHVGPAHSADPLKPANEIEVTT